jgi:hypothetical protein
VHHLRSEQEVTDAVIVRERLRNDYTDEHGPFDVVGDIHGCRSELETLLTELGYTLVRDDRGRPVDAHHDGRKAIFVGDLVDRGPDSPGVLRLVMGMVRSGHALCVPGNHEHKLVRALRGRAVRVSHGLGETLAQLAEQTPEFRAEVESFCDDLVTHLVLDDGRLVVAHAGLKQAYHGRASGRVRSFALYGDTTGETDEFGRFNNSLAMDGTGIEQHDVSLPDLEPGHEYVYVLQGTTADGTLYRSEVETFTIPETDAADTEGDASPQPDLGENLATGADIADVSSEFGDNFAAEFAIDGDLSTQQGSECQADLGTAESGKGRLLLDGLIRQPGLGLLDADPEPRIAGPAERPLQGQFKTALLLDDIDQPGLEIIRIEEGGDIDHCPDHHQAQDTHGCQKGSKQPFHCSPPCVGRFSSK